MVYCWIQNALRFSCIFFVMSKYKSFIFARIDPSLKFNYMFIYFTLSMIHALLDPFCFLFLKVYKLPDLDIKGSYFQFKVGVPIVNMVSCWTQNVIIITLVRINPSLKFSYRLICTPIPMIHTSLDPACFLVSKGI